MRPGCPICGDMSIRNCFRLGKAKAIGTKTGGSILSLLSLLPKTGRKRSHYVLFQTSIGTNRTPSPLDTGGFGRRGKASVTQLRRCRGYTKAGDTSVFGIIILLTTFTNTIEETKMNFRLGNGNFRGLNDGTFAFYPAVKRNPKDRHPRPLLSVEVSHFA